jgi:hypothetical protein
VNQKKLALEGQFDTKSLVWGIYVDTDTEMFHLPDEKRLGAWTVLTNPAFDFGSVRIPIHDLQVLRGSAEHWTVVCAALCPELSSIDRLLTGKGGWSFPKGTRAERERAYEDFWESIEMMRVCLGDVGKWSNSFGNSIARILDRGERLPLLKPDTPIAWIGTDATLTTCAAVD